MSNYKNVKGYIYKTVTKMETLKRFKKRNQSETCINEEACRGTELYPESHKGGYYEMFSEIFWVNQPSRIQPYLQSVLKLISFQCHRYRKYFIRVYILHLSGI